MKRSATPRPRRGVTPVTATHARLTAPDSHPPPRREREHCITLNLDTKHRLIATTTVSVGSVDHTFMSPREVFRDALLHGAAALVIAHNHPSGDAEPSLDDQRITRRLTRAGELVGVEILDHIVTGHERWVSLARRGALTNDAAASHFQLDAADVRGSGRGQPARGL